MKSNRHDPERHPERQGGRWYVTVVTGLAAVALIWAISEAPSLKAKPYLEIATER